VNLSLSLTGNMSLTATAAAAFDPLTLSPEAWYDPSDLTTLFQASNGTTAVTADGDPVGYIADKSGNGQHLIMATAANRPLYKTSGGLHWLEFDGTNDGLACASVTMPASTDTFCAYYNSAAKTQYVMMANAGGTTFIMTAVSADGSLPYQGAGSPDHFVNGVDTTETRGALFTAIGSSAPKVVEVRTADLSAWGSIRLFDYAGFVSGGRFYGMLICPALSASDRTSARTYLAGKSGVSL
jgi:hypothetical protein